VSYAYDAAGRLAGVTDPTGQTARYSYDAAGNITAVQRYSAAQVVILSVTPATARPGDSVTIAGSGFDASAANDTVTIGGAAATVTSATTRRLVVTVLGNAATGPVVVTTPAGSGTSPTTLTIRPSQAPQITSATPAILAPGTSFTISGSGFATVKANDLVAINQTQGEVTAASAASLTVTAPAAASGRLTVRTPGGKATGADLFIAPPPFTAAQISATTRMAVGDTRTVTIPTAGSVGLAVFDGQAGHRVLVNLSGDTLPGCDLDLNVYDPHGTTLGQLNSICTSGQLSIPTRSDGTYELGLVANGTATGSVTVSLQDVPADDSQALTIGGGSKQVTITIPGQKASFTFQGTVGQRIQLQLSGSTINGSVIERLYTPAGGQIWDGSGNAYLDATLPLTGKYTLTVDPSGTATGSLTATGWSVPTALTETVSLDGATHTTTLDTRGLDAYVAFDASTVRAVKLTVTATTMGCNAAVSILDPGEGTLTSDTCAQQGDTLITDLPAAGTYRVFINPAQATTGTLSFTVASVADLPTQSITVDGPAVSSTFASGQNATFTFAATGGRRLVSTPTVSWGASNAHITVTAPDGSKPVNLAWANSGSKWA
jgi:YD repeat-containing protein